jgi:hypothetical protein
VCLGGFENQRQEYAWQGHTLELDETRYEWGTLYELECETVRAGRRAAAAAVHATCLMQRMQIHQCMHVDEDIRLHRSSAVCCRDAGTCLHSCLLP